MHDEFDEDATSADFLRDFMLGVYLDGQCYALALSLHHGTGWPMVGLITTNNVIRHAMVQRPDGLLHDARGAVDPSKAGESFGIRGEQQVLRPITEDELLATKPVHGVTTALKMAQALWPDLPWLPDTPLKKARAFVADLEALCRQHNIWLRGAVPASPPLLSDGIGTERYDIVVTDDAMGYQVVRCFGEGSK